MKQYKKSKTDKVPKTSRSPKPGLNQKDKSKFRSSTEWKDFRLQKIEESENKCDLCNNIFIGNRSRKLNLHHRCLDPRQYTDISDKTRFSILCSNCHEFCHTMEKRVNNKKIPCTDSDILSIVKRFFI